MGRREYLLLLLVVALFAFSTRAFLYHWKNIFGIDSYWFARMGRYVLLNGELPQRDPLYSWGFYHPKINKELSMYLPAWYYRIRFGEEYSENKWFTVLKDLSAGFGVIGSLASALAVSAVAGAPAGIVAGVLAGTNPGYVYRTMAGFYEDDAVGLSLFLLGVWLFLEGMRRKKRKMKWALYTLAAISWLGVAISWKVYELVVFSLMFFLVLVVSRIFIDWAKEKVPERYREHVYGAGLSALLSLLIWLVWRYLALRSAVKTLETVGYLTTDINGVGSATLLSLGIHPLAVVFMGVFSYYLTLSLIKREKTYLYYSLAAFLLSLPFYQLSAVHGFAQVLTLPDGREVYVGYGEVFSQVGGRIPGVDLYQMIFGTIFLVFMVQVASALVATALEKSRLPVKNLGEFGLATALVLAVGFLAIFYNGYNWLSDTMGGTPGLIEQRASIIGATVVEERYGYYFWAPKYSILALFTLFAVPFLVYRSRKPEYLFLLAVFGITLYTGWIKLKTCYYFGAPLGMVAGLVLTHIWEEAKDRELKKYISLLILVIALASLATGIYHTVGRIPTLLTEEEVNEASLIAPIASDIEWVNGPEFLEAFEFIEKNTEKNAPIFNWWGVGHWLAFFTEHPLVTDNTNRVFEADRYVAKTFLAEWNVGYGMIKEKNYEYVLWLRDYVYASSSFALYAYGFKEGKNIARDYFFSITGPCKRSSLGSYYNCGEGSRPFFVDSNIVESAPSIIFAPLPFESLPKINGKYGVYRAGARLVIVSKKMNESLLFLLWKGGNEHFKPIFVSSRGKVVVYRVI